MKRFPLSVLLLLFLLSHWSPALAACVQSGSTRTADTCSQSDVQACVTAAQAGDTIILPAQMCHWSTQVDWTSPANVMLKGAGTSALGGGDQTVIIDDITTGGHQYVLGVTTSATGTFRITGITFQGGTGEYKDYGFILLSGQSKQFRIDHMHFNQLTYPPSTYGKQIYVNGWTYGVIDHNIFDLIGATNGVSINMGAYGGDTLGGSGQGDYAWSDPAFFGSEKFVYVEDNQFSVPAGSSPGAMNDCTFGGRQAFRFNDVISSMGIQSHGSQAGRRRGCRAWEVYANRMVGDNNHFTNAALYHETGSVVAWGNAAPSGFCNFMKVQYDRSTTPYGSPPDHFGNCGTILTGTGSDWDGNTDVPTGYPCLDQMGRGAGDLLRGLFPDATNTATGCIYNQTCAYPRQAIEPAYEWLNTWVSAYTGCGDFWSLYSTDVPVVTNRDYYLYTPSFTGATGVGSGTLASRPSTCTPLTAYWATDQGSWNAGTNSFYTGQGILYTCTATNTWTASYTPYPYPHPLVTGSQAPTTPTILRLVR